MRVIGLDPGLRVTGWGVIEVAGHRLRHLGHGVVRTDPAGGLGARLNQIHEGLIEVLQAYEPDEAAVESALANRNATATLKLGMARGVVVLAPTRLNIPVAEYLPMIVKKAVVGTGHAAKQQVTAMIQHLLPGCGVEAPDAADALAVAICHAHRSETTRRWAGPTRRSAATAWEREG